MRSLILTKMSHVTGFLHNTTPPGHLRRRLHSFACSWLAAVVMQCGRSIRTLHEPQSGGGCRCLFSSAVITLWGLQAALLILASICTGASPLFRVRPCRPTASARTGMRSMAISWGRRAYSKASIHTKASAVFPLSAYNLALGLNRPYSCLQGALAGTLVQP